LAPCIALSGNPEAPEAIYAQIDPVNWDPFSRANRIASVHNYCVHQSTTDDGLRRSLDFMERKVDLAREQRIEANDRLSNRESKRSLFNYKYLPAPEKDLIATMSRSTLHSHISEYLINCIQMSELALARGHKRAAHRCQYYRKKLREGSWIEDRFLETKSETTNTFFLMSSLEHGLVELRSQSSSVPDWRLPKQLSTEALSDALRKLQSASLFNFADIIHSRGAKDQKDLVLGSANRDAFFAVNHEIIENSMSHGVVSAINPHVARSSLEDFGKVFFLQTSTENYTVRKSSNSDYFPEGFADYHRASCGSKLTGKQKYRVVTYFDTGLGVQQHLKKFGDIPGDRSISQIAKERLSARPIIGSGRGFEKMKMFTAGLRAFLTVATPDSTYSFNGFDQSESETDSSKVIRGTVVSVFLPEK